VTEAPGGREPDDEGAETIYGDEPGSESAAPGGISGPEQKPEPGSGTIYSPPADAADES
jgi:hypothetical protein